MRKEIIKTTIKRDGLLANLQDYSSFCSLFSWEKAAKELTGLPGKKGMNIAHEAIDRHTQQGKANKIALRFIGKSNDTTDLTFQNLKELSNQFDALGMLLPALQDPNPVLICEHTTLYNLEEQVNPEIEAVPIDKAAIRRVGTDVTIIAYGAMVHKALNAAEELSEEGINAEVIDLRILRPLDTETIISSVIKTHRVVVVDEGWKSGSLSAEIITRIIENAFYDLDAPPARVCTEEVPIPYPKHLEDAAIPQVASIKEACKTVVGHHV